MRTHRTKSAGTASPRRSNSKSPPEHGVQVDREIMISSSRADVPGRLSPNSLATQTIERATDTAPRINRMNSTSASSMSIVSSQLPISQRDKRRSRELDQNRESMKALAEFLKTKEPPPTNYMSIPDDRSEKSIKSMKAFNKLILLSLRPKKKMPKALIQLPESAVSARTREGARHIAISIPLNYPELRNEKEQCESEFDRRPPSPSRESPDFEKITVLKPVHEVHKSPSMPSSISSKGNRSVELRDPEKEPDQPPFMNGPPRSSSLEGHHPHKHPKSSPNIGSISKRLEGKGVSKSYDALSTDLARHDSHRTDPRHSGGTAYSIEPLSPKQDIFSTDVLKSSTIGKESKESFDAPPEKDSLIFNDLHSKERPISMASLQLCQSVINSIYSDRSSPPTVYGTAETAQRCHLQHVRQATPIQHFRKATPIQDVQSPPPEPPVSAPTRGLPDLSSIAASTPPPKTISDDLPGLIPENTAFFQNISPKLPGLLPSPSSTPSFHKRKSAYLKGSSPRRRSRSRHSRHSRSRPTSTVFNIEELSIPSSSNVSSPNSRPTRPDRVKARKQRDVAALKYESYRGASRPRTKGDIEALIPGCDRRASQIIIPPRHHSRVIFPDSAEAIRMRSAIPTVSLSPVMIVADIAPTSYSKNSIVHLSSLVVTHDHNNNINSTNNSLQSRTPQQSSNRYPYPHLSSASSSTFNPNHINSSLPQTLSSFCSSPSSGHSLHHFQGTNISPSLPSPQSTLQPPIPSPPILFSPLASNPNYFIPRSRIPHALNHRDRDRHSLVRSNQGKIIVNSSMINGLEYGAMGTGTNLQRRVQMHVRERARGEMLEERLRKVEGEMTELLELLNGIAGVFEGVARKAQGVGG